MGWIVAVGVAAAALWLAAGDRIRRLAGWHDNAAFPLLAAMGERLARTDAPAPMPLRHWSRKRALPSQMTVIDAYFRRFSQLSLPTPAADNGPRSADRVFVEEWLRPRLPATPEFVADDRVALLSLAEALERLRNRVTGLARTETSERWSEKRLLEHASALMAQIDAATDFRNWYTGPSRRWMPDGQAAEDPEARACALAFTAPGGAAVASGRIGALRGAWRRWGLSGMDPRDDGERPWLVCGVFFEVFSLRRLGFSATYAGEATAVLPLEPALARERLSARSFDDRAVADGLATLAKALGVYRADGTPGDWLADVTTVYDREDRWRWLRERLRPATASDPSSGGASPETRLGDWLDEWLRRRAALRAEE